MEHVLKSSEDRGSVCAHTHSLDLIYTALKLLKWHRTHFKQTKARTANKQHRKGVALNPLY